MRAGRGMELLTGHPRRQGQVIHGYSQGCAQVCNSGVTRITRAKNGKWRANYARDCCLMRAWISVTWLYIWRRWAIWSSTFFTAYITVV